MKDFIDGIKIIFSRKFWNDFVEYYSAENIAKRIQKLKNNKKDEMYKL